MVGIFSGAAFTISSTTNSLRSYSTGQLLFGHHMILPINHTVDWELTSQKKQAKTNKDNIQKIVK